MPYGDRTGPMGMGPRTGRMAGTCAGFGMPGAMNPAGGRGAWGRGARGGGGRGWRHWFYATGLPSWARGGMAVPAPPSAGPVPPAMGGEAEMDMLKAQAEQLEQTLGSLRQRIQTLQRGAKAE
ncbi:MAG: DUF5320 domain-containing protein [Candidatus Methylomirabilota bacterium]